MENRCCSLLLRYAVEGFDEKTIAGRLGYDSVEELIRRYEFHEVIYVGFWLS